MATFSRQQRLAELDLHNAKLMVSIARDTDTSSATANPTHELTKPGDIDAARGVPIQGYPGSSGAIAGTRP